MGFFASKTLELGCTPTLLDPRFDHDSCGVGFVATLRNIPSHEILTQALTALARLAHRGAIAADGKSSDGVGIMTAIPREFLLHVHWGFARCRAAAGGGRSLFSQ